MGSFVVNFHIRSQDPSHVRQQLEEAGAETFHVSNSLRDWISAYEERASDQDERWIEHLNRDLSQRLRTVCVAFLVHDSDIARYWLHDRGELLDAYNSIPDYFETVSIAIHEQFQGQPKVFVRYCRAGITEEAVAEVLRDEVTFADEIIAQLADFLGIAPDRALTDFRDDDEGPSGSWDIEEGEGWTDGSEEDDPSPLRILKMSDPGGLMQSMQDQLATLMGLSNNSKSSPLSDDLVQAAIREDISQIDRLIESGVDINAPGTMPFEQKNMLPIQGFPPGIQLPPLMAAASKGKSQAVRILIDRGARTNDVHPILGSVLHLAVQSGSSVVVQTLLDAGVSPNIQNAMNQTPLAILKSIRQTQASLHQLMKSVPTLKNLAASDPQFTHLEMLTTEWEECESVLRKSGAY